MTADPLGKLPLTDGQCIRAQLGPSWNCRQSSGGHPVDATHLDRVEKAKVISTLDGQLEDRRRHRLLGGGNPLKTPTEHRVDHQVMAVDVEKEELATPPDPLEGTSAELTGEVL